MSEDDKRNLHNALVLVLADGNLAEEEKQYIESLRERLGISRTDLAQLCKEIREGRRQIVVPRDAELAERTLHLLVETAAADRQIRPVEQRLLRRLADCVGIKPARLDALIGEAMGYPELDAMEMETSLDEVYRHFAEWDDAARRAKLADLAERSRLRIEPLVRILESYRVPDGMRDALSLKVMTVDELSRLGDTRPVYYLAQQVSIGDSDDEITNFALRAAGAEAIGKITGEGFARDQGGIEAAREWWLGEGSVKYDYLV
jgi:uncharacterized tellurite resistance protein B-like protein